MRPHLSLSYALGSMVLLGTSVLGLASPANAVSGTCLGQTFTVTGSTCTVEPGETVAFQVSSTFGGAGWSDPSSTGLGGQGGVGAKISGTYTNTSGTTETITMTLGADGAFGTNISPTGSNGGASSLAVGATTIVSVSGGTGGTASSAPSTNGTNGTNGALTYPGSLPSGWTSSISLASQAVFSVPPADSSSGPSSSHPADERQQVEVPASGSCADVDDSQLKWGTTLTGGWHFAWGDWVNRVVCSRTFHYGSDGWEITA